MRLTLPLCIFCTLKLRWLTIIWNLPPISNPWTKTGTFWSTVVIILSGLSPYHVLSSSDYRGIVLEWKIATQSAILKDRFLEKGYASIDLDTEIDLISRIDRNSLLQVHPKKATDNKFRWSFFTTYSIQSRQIKEILKKHWGVLQYDRYLGPILPERARVIFRGAQSIQGQIAPYVIDPLKKVSFFSQCKGYFPCRKCNVCLYNISARRRSDTFQSSVTLHIYPMERFTTCTT